MPTVGMSSEKQPCDSRKICPVAYEQGLVACDAETQRCVCERGYKLENGRCVGLSNMTIF